MKTYRYEDQDGAYELTEDEIIDYYFKHWSERMKKVGKENLISKDRCIEDFVVVH